jgi:hypothetical protein
VDHEVIVRFFQIPSKHFCGGHMAVRLVHVSMTDHQPIFKPYHPASEPEWTPASTGPDVDFQRPCTPGAPFNDGGAPAGGAVAEVRWVNDELDAAAGDVSIPCGSIKFIIDPAHFGHRSTGRCPSVVEWGPDQPPWTRCWDVGAATWGTRPLEVDVWAC